MEPYSKYPKDRQVIEMYRMIKSNPYIKRKVLADIFEVTTKTIGYWITDLTDIWDVEIDYDSSLKKYIILDEGNLEELRTANPLSETDVHLILITLMNSRAFMPVKMEIIQNALLNILPKEEADNLRKNLPSLLSMQRKQSNQEEVNLYEIRQAMVNKKKISFLYKSAGAEFPKNYRVIPYSFACDLGKYYIIAKPDDIDELRHYRLDRITNIKVLDEPGVPDKEFNAASYLRKTWYMYSGDEAEVMVKFNIDCYKVVTERSMQEGRVVEKNDECFIYKFICNGTEGIKLWLMGFGGDAEVLEPVELRKEMGEIARKMVEVYGK